MTTQPESDDLPPLQEPQDIEGYFYRQQMCGYARSAIAADRAKRADRIMELLREAVDDIEAWAAYASPYFQDKHDLAGTLAKYRAALEREVRKP